MSLVSPPERVVFQKLILLKVLPDPPALVVGQSESVLLEESVDSGDAVVPGLFQIIKGQSSILSLGLLSLQRVLSPNSLTVYKFTLPCLYISEQVRNQLVLLMTHPRTIVTYPQVRLFTIFQITLRNQNMSHGQHPQST